MINRICFIAFLLSMLVSSKMNGQAVFDTIFRPENLQSGATYRYSFDFDTTGNAWVSFYTNGLGKFDIQTNKPKQKQAAKF